MKLSIAEKTGLGFSMFDNPTDEQIAAARQRKAAELAEYEEHARKFAATTKNGKPWTDEEKAALWH